MGTEHIEFDLKLSQFKGGFFDRDWVRDTIGPLAKRALSLFGARVRKYAQGRIKDREGKTSSPGEGPTNQTGLLRDFIFFAFSPDAGGGLGGVVVGPSRLGGRRQGAAGPTPQVLEYGGPAVVKVFRKTGRRNRYGGEEREYVGDRIVAIAPRPYMRPAFDSVFPGQMPAIWERAATSRGLPAM